MRYRQIVDPLRRIVLQNSLQINYLRNENFQRKRAVANAFSLGKKQCTHIRPNKASAESYTFHAVLAGPFKQYYTVDLSNNREQCRP